MWRASFLLAPLAGGLLWFGAPLWLALAPAAALMFGLFGKGTARRAEWAVLPVALAAALVPVILHATAGPVPPGPPVVAFGPGQYSSYGAPSFTVDAANNGAGPVTVHRVTVRFVNDRTGQVIADVTEAGGVTVPAGQGQTLTYPAPQAVAGPAGPAISDRSISVTVTGWS